MSSDAIHGRYFYENEKYKPDAGMQKINAIKRKTKMLADSGPEHGAPIYLFNPNNNSYWESVIYEDYSEDLKQVTREGIESRFPALNCDKLIDVDWEWSMSPDIIRGRYRYENKKWIQDEWQEKINKMKRRMKLLSGSGPSYPFFLYDPTDKSYWEYRKYQNGCEEMKQVTREYIESKFPKVNCDKMIDVNW